MARSEQPPSAPVDAASTVVPGPALVLIGSRIAGPAPAAVWLTAAGWAEAARRRFGQVLLVTAHGTMDIADARAAATTPGPEESAAKRGAPRRLGTLRDAAKDARELIRALSFMRQARRAVPPDSTPALVWQHHELWQWSGWLLSRRYRVPWVLFVDAPIVWESKVWGVRRPGWGRIVERFGEVPQLRLADVVACVSPTVAEQVRKLGVPPDRVLVTPCCADPNRFRPRGPQARQLKRDLGLDDRIVVGWLGSFRRFHGIDLLLDAYEAARKHHPELALLLVGEGPERGRVEADIRRRRLPDVTLTGMVSHDEVPHYLAAMDIGVVVDPGTAQWHYSPLKLQEYLACGLAVVAPRSGGLEALVGDHEHALLVPPGDSRALASSLCELARSPSLRERLGKAARARSEEDGGWDTQLRSVMDLVATRRD